MVSLYGGRDPRDLPLYTVAEAAVYLGVPVSTLRTWVRGQEIKGRHLMHSVIAQDRDTHLLTFTNLTEAYVLASLTRKFQLPLKRVRAALEYVGGDHPLLKPFRTDGRGIFVDQMGALIDATKGGQAAIKPFVESTLERVELDNMSLPMRLYPWRRDPSEPRTVAIDPRHAFGKPTVAGHGVQLAVIVDRYQGGDRISQLAADYSVDQAVIEDVVRWGLDAAKAA